MAFGGSPALLAPNADAAGVPYDVPGTDWKAGVRPFPLPLLVGVASVRCTKRP
jgi:hypothetical protein